MALTGVIRNDEENEEDMGDIPFNVALGVLKESGEFNIKSFPVEELTRLKNNIAVLSPQTPAAILKEKGPEGYQEAYNHYRNKHGTSPTRQEINYWPIEADFNEDQTKAFRILSLRPKS